MALHCFCSILWHAWPSLTSRRKREGAEFYTSPVWIWTILFYLHQVLGWGNIFHAAERCSYNLSLFFVFATNLLQAWQIVAEIVIKSTRVYEPEEGCWKRNNYPLLDVSWFQSLNSTTPAVFLALTDLQIGAYYQIHSPRYTTNPVAIGHVR